MLQNIGGFAEILIFFFCYVMIYHHDVLMNLFLLNSSILMNEYNQKSSKTRTSQIADAKSQKLESKYERQAYTYWELVRLRFLWCCGKKNARYVKYQEHMEIMAERLDIATLISSEGYLNALSNVLMEPYQMKIISYFKKRKDDGTKLAYSIPIGEAVNRLKTRT